MPLNMPLCTPSWEFLWLIYQRLNVWGLGTKVYSFQIAQKRGCTSLHVYRSDRGVPTPSLHIRISPLWIFTHLVVMERYLTAILIEKHWFLLWPHLMNFLPFGPTLLWVGCLCSCPFFYCCFSFSDWLTRVLYSLDGNHLSVNIIFEGLCGTEMLDIDIVRAINFFE